MIIDEWALVRMSTEPPVFIYDSHPISCLSPPPTDPIMLDRVYLRRGDERRRLLFPRIISFLQCDYSKGLALYISHNVTRGELSWDCVPSDSVGRRKSNLGDGIRSWVWLRR